MSASIRSTSNDFFSDCRHAARLYKRTPVASLNAICALAIGISFMALFVSLYADMVLRPHLGFEHSERLASVGPTLEGNLLVVPYDVINRLGEDLTTVETAAGISIALTLVGTEQVEARALSVTQEISTEFLPRMTIGRRFEPADHLLSAEPVVLLTYEFWQDYFRGDPSILGTTIQIAISPNMIYRGPPEASIFDRHTPKIDSAYFRIVGVLDKSLSSLIGPDEQFWLPFEPSYPLFNGVPETIATAGMRAFVRTTPGASISSLLNEFRDRYDSNDSPLTHVPGSEIQAINGIVSNIDIKREAGNQLKLLLCGSLLLLGVTVANVSLFLLGRMPSRFRELRIRRAVGAGATRIARQLATEVGLLVAGAAIIGLFASSWLGTILQGLAFMQNIDSDGFHMLNLRTLSLISAILAVLVLLLSLVPIVSVSRLELFTSVTGSHAVASQARRFTGVAQLAIAGTLGGAAIVLGWHLANLTFGDAGYEMKDRLIVRFEHFNAPERTTATVSENTIADRVNIELTQRRESLLSIPGVDAIGFGEPIPGRSSSVSTPAEIADPLDPTRKINVYAGALNAPFVRVIGYSLVHGRVPEQYEPGSVLVNQALGRALWGREDVVGERVPGSLRWNTEGSDIVGVLKDLSFDHPAATVRPFVFVTGAGGLEAVVETSLSAADLHSSIDELIAEGALDATVNEVTSLSALRRKLLAPDRARGYVTISAAILVLILTGMGCYGMQHYVVASERRENAIRASLGASPSAIARLIFSRSLRSVLPGLVLGGLLAFIAASWFRTNFNISGVSPLLVTFAVVSGLCIVVFLATLGPASRSRNALPAAILRGE